jgi:putative oxidoreductase
LNFLERMQPLGLLVLRLVLGAIMIAHGYTKVFGGMPHFVDTVRGIHLPGWLAYLSAATEFGGGMLLIAGFLTRFVALCVCVDMVVAIFGVHLKNGFMGQGNYQFPLALAAIAFSLMFTGAGPISIDGMRGRGR